MKRLPIFNKSLIGDFQLSLHAANANSQRTVFAINMPPSFLLCWIATDKEFKNDNVFTNELTCICMSIYVLNKLVRVPKFVFFKADYKRDMYLKHASYFTGYT